MAKSFLDSLKEKTKSQEQLVKAIDEMEIDRSQRVWTRLKYFCCLLAVIGLGVTCFIKSEPIMHYINKKVSFYTKDNKDIENIVKSANLAMMKFNIYMFGSQKSNWDKLAENIQKGLDRTRNHLLRVWSPKYALENPLKLDLSGLFSSELTAENPQAGGNATEEKKSPNLNPAELTLMQKLELSWKVVTKDVEHFWDNRKPADQVMGPTMPKSAAATAFAGPINPANPSSNANPNATDPNAPQGDGVNWNVVNNRYEPPTARRQLDLNAFGLVIRPAAQVVAVPSRARARVLSSIELARLNKLLSQTAAAKPPSGAYRQGVQPPQP